MGVLSIVKGVGSTTNRVLVLADASHVEFTSMEQLEGLASLGLIPNAFCIRKYGNNISAVTGDLIISQAAIGAGYEAYTFESVAFSAEVASDAAADTEIPLSVTGLDASGLPQTKAVLTDAVTGTAGSAIPGTWLSITRGKVTGPALPVGNISIGKGAPQATGIHTAANMKARIDIGAGQTELAVWKVPTGYTLLMKEWSAGGAATLSAAAKTALLHLLVKPPGGSNLVKSHLHINTAGNVSDRKPMYWEAYEGGSEIRVAAKAVSAATEIWAEFYGIYLKDAE